MKPFIHPFKTIGGYYIYDVNSNQIIKVDRELYSYIVDGILGGDVSQEPSKKTLEEANRLQMSGLLKTTRVKEVENSDSYLIESILNKNLNHFVLQITQGCNLRCKYCVYTGNYENRDHTTKKMSKEFAFKAIDFYVEKSVHSENLMLGFYGGEPLLEFDLIIQCMEYMNKKAEGKNVKYNMTVNGTLLTVDKVAILEKYNCIIVVSLDGPKEIHDRNRIYVDGRGSYDTIIRNLTEIKKSFPEFFSKNIKFNMVLDTQNDLSCLNEIFSDSSIFEAWAFSINDVSNLYKKDDDYREEHEGSIIMREYELFKLYLKKIGRFKTTNIMSLYETDYTMLKARMINWHENRRELPEKAHPGGPCTPGKKRIFVNADGNLYPCERVSESSEVMKIGNINDGFDFEKVRNLINIGKITEQQCIHCWAFTYCTQCAAYADEFDKFSKKRRLQHCENVRATVENMFVEYCTLKELGHKFDNNAHFEII